MKRNCQIPEQIIRKLRTGRELMNHGETVADIRRALGLSAMTHKPLAAEVRRDKAAEPNPSRRWSKKTLSSSAFWLMLTR